MTTHFDLTDKEFTTQFRTCQLDPELFTHEAHLRLAWIYLKTYGIDRSVEELPMQFRAFVAHAGATDKYNETVTVAALKVVNHFLASSSEDNFLDFVANNPRLMTDFMQLLASHYSIDIFNSERARKEYVEPDLLDFDSVDQN